MFWKSAGSYDAVPIIIGMCIDIYTSTYCVWQHVYLCLWLGFTPKFPRSFETERKCKLSIYFCLKEGPKSKDSEVWFGQAPRSWDGYLKLLHLQFWLDQLRTGVVMTFPVLLIAIQVRKEHLLHHNTFRFGELEGQTGKVEREKRKVGLIPLKTIFSLPPKLWLYC